MDKPTIRFLDEANYDHEILQEVEQIFHNIPKNNREHLFNKFTNIILTLSKYKIDQLLETHVNWYKTFERHLLIRLLWLCIYYPCCT